MYGNHSSSFESNTKSILSHPEINWFKLIISFTFALDPHSLSIISKPEELQLQ